MTTTIKRQWGRSVGKRLRYVRFLISCCKQNVMPSKLGSSLDIIMHNDEEGLDAVG